LPIFSPIRPHDSCDPNGLAKSSSTIGDPARRPAGRPRVRRTGGTCPTGRRNGRNRHRPERWWPKPDIAPTSARILRQTPWTERRMALLGWRDLRRNSPPVRGGLGQVTADPIPERRITADQTYRRPLSRQQPFRWLVDNGMRPRKAGAASSWLTSPEPADESTGRTASVPPASAAKAG